MIVRPLTWGRLMFGGGAAVGMLAHSLAAVVVRRLLMAVGGALIIPTAMALLVSAVLGATLPPVPGQRYFRPRASDLAN